MDLIPSSTLSIRVRVRVKVGIRVRVRVRPQVQIRVRVGVGVGVGVSSNHVPNPSMRYSTARQTLKGVKAHSGHSLCSQN